jgi:hypothetical protein
LTEKVIQSESGARTAVDQKKPLYADATGATAPSLKKRKNRSSRNALKSGIFSKSLILESESRDEYQLLLNGVRKDLQPEGTVESELVESIAFLLWRNRRLLQAENAEIAKARFSTPLEAYEKQQAELWDRYRAGETAGGDNVRCFSHICRGAGLVGRREGLRKAQKERRWSPPTREKCRS